MKTRSDTHNTNNSFDSHKILVVDDDERYALMTKELLAENYTVFVASSGEEALRVACQVMPDIILLDIRMRGVDGVSVCESLRGHDATRDVSIIMLTAANDIDTRVQAFAAGADDFITKPYTDVELVTRVSSKIRRIDERKKANKFIACGNLLINLDREEVTVQGDPVALTAHEFRLLRFMVENRETVQTREHILKSVWCNSVVIDRAVDTHMSALRRKLARFDHVFESIYGRGYMLKGRWKERANEAGGPHGDDVAIERRK